MNNSNENVAFMSSVTMEKSKLIEILKDNKEKHDAIFATALLGYWDEAKEKLTKKYQEFTKTITELTEDVNYQFDKLNKKLDKKEPLDNNSFINIKFGFNHSLGIIFPENHSKDYEKAINKLELSIYDKVVLSEEEYDQYVLNNWEWKKSFLASNSAYLGKGESVKSRNRVLYASEAGSPKYGDEFLKSVAEGKSNF